MPLRDALRVTGGRVKRSHRHLTVANAAFVAACAALVGILVAGSLQLAGAGRRASPVKRVVADATVSAVPSATAEPIIPSPIRTLPVLPVLPALRTLVPASVLVTNPRPLSPGTIRRIVAVSRARASLLISAGDVRLGRGRTRALAADPVAIRAWTPSLTGRAVGVWQRAVIGEAVVAHAVAKADAVTLGGTVGIAAATASLRMRVGALATTQLPGVGLVVNEDAGRQLGLLPGTGLLLSVRGTDPAVVTALVKKQLGAGAVVEPVLSSVARRGGWVPPAIGPITSPFGMRINPFTHMPQFHEGIDIGAPLASPVYAMTDGQVLYAGPASGYGNEIVLSHAGGVTTVYGHVSQIFVTTGPVRAGQVIAVVGSEGESTGPHLHAEVHVDDVPVDPIAWLKDHGVVFTR